MRVLYAIAIIFFFFLPCLNVIAIEEWDGSSFSTEVQVTGTQEEWGSSSFSTEVQVTGLIEEWQSSSFSTRVGVVNWSAYGGWWVATIVNITAPTELNATAYNTTSVNLTWTIGINADTTRIQRQTGTYPTGIGEGTMVYNSTGSAVNDTGLTPSTHYYYSAWSFNATYQYSDYVTDDCFTESATMPPTNLFATPYNDTLMNLTWTQGDPITVVKQKLVSYPTDPTDGTEIYNSTGSSYQADGLTASTRYYFRAWSYDGSNYSALNTSYNNWTRPQSPQDVYANYSIDTNLTFEWTNGTGSNYTIMRRNTSEYPATPQSGAVVFNGTDETYVEAYLTQTMYYKMWSYSLLSGFFSRSVNAPWGAIAMSCYNESNTTQAIEFDLEIANADASLVYKNTSLQNYHFIDLNDIPYGEDTLFVISNASYYDSLYYYDLYINHFYNYTFYLPPITAPPDGGGPDTKNQTRLYRFRIIDENFYPVAGATVDVRRFINRTQTYENVRVLITNGYGEADVPLRPNVHYILFITATGFDEPSPAPSWFPDPESYGPENVVIFGITSTIPSIPTFGFWSICTFTASYYDNNTLIITYDDANLNTTDAQFYTYELDFLTSSLISTNTTSSDSFSFYVTVSNASRSHRISLRLNHTNLGFHNQSIIVMPYRTPTLDEDVIEDIIEDVAGDFLLGYVTTFFLYVPTIIILVLTGKQHPGFGTIACGLYMGFYSFFLAVPANLLLLAPFIVAIGIILMIVKGSAVKL